VSASCRDFRRLLESRLAGRAASERIADLAWHEHLFGCAECRALLDAEEALESLLASLPEPRLAPEVKGRVLARLRVAALDERLDRLLDAAAEPAPRDLAQSVLRGVSARVADERLDRLLELDVVAAPEGLAARTIASLRLARRAAVRRATVVRITAAFAAAAALVFVVWLARRERVRVQEPAPTVVDAPGPTPRVDERSEHGFAASGATAVARGTSTQVPDEMLASLDVLLHWDVLVDEDVETLLSTLPADQAALLLEIEDEG
jgi:hypothetical protein